VQSATKRRTGPDAFRRDVDAMAQLRRRMLGDRAAGPPRFLVRVDEFPHYLAWDDPARYGTDRFRRFHEVMRSAGVPYLVAALPRISRHPLDPGERRSRPLHADEVSMLARIHADGTGIALHGRDHRTRWKSARRHSELTGLDRHATAELLDAGLAELHDQIGVRPRVFVAPYNRFTARQWPTLAERFSVIGGGPESIRMFGVQSTPQWRGDAVYLPAYAPFYAPAGHILDAARQTIERAPGIWVPIALHWGWEADAQWRDLERLAALIAPHTADWADFLDAVDRSR
jgi:peptidoglycan/xylan/chitin deacetylase (PgdA/CDA1 family)